MRRCLWTWLALFGCLSVNFVTDVSAENWPRFRGPNGAGISSETGFPETWTENDYAWVINLPGIGHCSPVIWDDQLYVTAGETDGTVRRLLCYDAKTGVERWRRELALNDVHLHLKNSHASGSPATDGRHVVAVFGDETQLVAGCWTVDGKELWRQDLGEFLSEHGPACSPIIQGNLVIVCKEMKGPSAIFALDVETGKLVWKTEREFRRTSYATPIVRTRKDGVDEVICVSGMMGITGLELKTGKMLWKSPEFPMRTVGSPVLTEKAVLNLCGSGGSGKLLMAIPLDQTGEIEPMYTMSQKIPYVPTPIYKDGLLFFLLDGGILHCANAENGEEVWVERLGGKFTASPIWLDGRIYAVDEEGTVVVMKVGAEEFRELARVPLGEMSHSTPAVANGRLYFKTATKLFCLPAK
ncbi:MAG: PQQ-binding-like beta-propeller repeat protein [Planctomycetaceae bacterium]|nr:PQQ-binding-like beta-propeller repeat protein [Planctomycetaceae bacterium]